MPDVLVIGSLNADLVVRAPHFPRPGETIHGEDLQVIPGGKGANQAVAAARHGASVAMLGCVGNDGFGALLLGSLKSDNVDTSHVHVEDSATGTAVIVVDSNGQNSIVLAAGANRKLTAQHVDQFTSETRILLLQLEIPLETVIHAARWGKQRGFAVILNPAPARELPDELIANADYIVPNETELNLLTGVPVTDAASAEQAAKVLLNRGARNVIVTLGSNGVLVASSQQVTRINSFKVPVVDTTAAGDAFIGGFTFALLRGVDAIEAAHYGNACGALATMRFGAQPSLPTRDEVEEFISRSGT